MKITFALGSVSRRAGGLFEICRRLAQTVGVLSEVAVLGLRDPFTESDLPAWMPLRPEVLPTSGPISFGFARGYAARLTGSNPDLVHVHGLWMYPSFAAHRWSRKYHRPLVYSAHGMLDPWALRNSSWKKKTVRLLYEDAAHRDAACFHVNSEAELQAARGFGLRNPICVIPNGVDLPDLGSIPNSEFRIPNLDGRNVLLFLGRLHPKKNLGPLLQAWASVRRDEALAKNWVLAIAGWDQSGYEARLFRLAADLGLAPLKIQLLDPHAQPASSSVFFLGPLFGADKVAAYQNAAAFVLPSLSEGLPMAVLEAWAFAKPALITSNCNLPEGFQVNAALPIATDEQSISNGLRQLFGMSAIDRVRMGERGRRLVSRHFLWPQIGQEMRRVCDWVVGGGTAPASVRIWS